jgi:hypothetical protein
VLAVRSLRARPARWRGPSVDGGDEVSGWSIGSEGQRHRARLGRWGITVVVGRRKRPEAATFVGGRAVQWSLVAIPATYWSRGGGEMAAQVEGKRAVAALTGEEEGGSAFA